MPSIIRSVHHLDAFTGSGPLRRAVDPEWPTVYFPPKANSNNVLFFFRSVLRSYPQLVAIDAGSYRLTYHELDVLSSRLAWHIAAHIKSQHSPIPLLTSTSASAVIGILAIIKTGAPYVPIDCVQCSRDRLSSILKSINGSVLVYSDEFFPLTMVDQSYVAKIPISQSGLPLVNQIEKSNSWSLSKSTPEVLTLPTPPVTDYRHHQETACVIFTSGTTGKPKGVMIRHDSLANFVASRKPYLAPGTRSLLALSMSFDACNCYLFAMLCHGATVVVADLDTIQHRFSSCAFVVLTPSVLSSLVPPGGGSGETYEKLRTMMLGGETASQDLLSAWHPLAAAWTVYNEYGPTEATCAVLSGRFEYDSSLSRFENKLLGKSIAGAIVKLRDDDGNEIIGSGLEGELLIGGPCLAHGYWNDPARTDERFIDWRGSRFYRTGDRGRWHHVQGERICFLGRRDRVVKNRGFLVNLETEVDDAVLGSDLSKVYGISGVFTVMINGRMCMLTSPKDTRVENLRNDLARRLPTYHVPDRIMAVKALPLGLTGKIDPNAIKAMFQGTIEQHHELDSRGKLHQALEDWESDLLVGISGILGLPRRARPDESFVDLGGSSLAAVAVSSLFRKFGAHVRPRDILLSKSIRGLMDLCRHRGQEPEKQDCNPPLPCNAPLSAPMTKTQSQLLFASNSTPGSGVIQVFFTFPNEILPALKWAWRATLESESIFRMTFDLQQRTQNIGKENPNFLWEETVLEDEADIEAVSRQGCFPSNVGTSFHIFSSKSTSRMVWTIHHALVDGFSAALLLRKVGVALFSRSNPTPGPSFLRVVQEIQKSQEPLRNDAKTFWAQQKSRIPRPVGKIELPPPSNGCVGATNAVVEGGQPVSAANILGFSRQLTITPITLFYTAWAVLISRYTGSSDVVFGAVLSGRDATVTNIESTVGPLLCTSPLRARLNKSASIAEVSREIFSTLHSLLLYQWLPEEEEEETLYTAVASQQNFPSHPFKAEINDIRETTVVPLSLFVHEDWTFSINYRTDMYAEVQVSRLTESFACILRSMIEPCATVATCMERAIPEAERTRLLDFGNAFSPETSVGETTETILDIFDQTVRDYGHLRAVEKGDEVLTYADLDRASTKLAKRIVQYAAPGELVGFHATRSILWIVGIFAILKAGAVYCPLEESLPSEVRCSLFERSGAVLFMTSTTNEIRFAPVTAPPCLVVEDVLCSPEDFDGLPPSRSVHDLAYVCFTSGSTGEPKGVAVKHMGVVAMQKHLASRLHAEPGRRIMQFLAVGFDGSMLELFSALCYGATLVLRPDDDALAALQDVDIAILTPSAVEGLDPGQFPNLKHMYFGGEPLAQSTADRWAPSRHLYNYYGPTEVTMGSVLKKHEAGNMVTIGKPHPTVRAYILDEQRQLAPRGVVGEIVLAGVQVAQGYVGMVQETAAKFLPDTISAWSSEKMYLTGDLGYWTEDGEIVCLGRKDKMVKVRGFRVSLGTVEATLCAFPNVRAAAAEVKDGLLLAWVIPSSLDGEAIRDEIRSKLPPQAVPHRIFALETFPLTRNGKLDYRALVQNANVKRKGGYTQHVGELTRMEAIVAKIWQSLLDLEGVEIVPSDSFVSLGGHSMKQLALAARLSSTLGFRVPVQVVLQSQTLGDMAANLESLRTSLEAPVADRRRLGRVELSPAEYEWFLKYQSASPAAAAAFNVVFACSLSGVDVNKLAQVWSATISRHEILSSRFLTDSEHRPYRTFSSPAPQPRVVENVDVTYEARRPFNISGEGLIRVYISRSKLVVVISHILCDLTALRVLLNGVSAAYNLGCGAHSLSPPESLPYTETSCWFEEPHREDLEFWRKYLSGAPGPVVDPTPTDFSGTSKIFSLPSSVLERMAEFGARYSLTTYQTILMGTAMTLLSLTQKSDIVVGTPYMNRSTEQELNTVGLFLQPLPFRLDLSDLTGEGGILALAQRTRMSFEDMLSHPVPWRKLLTHLGLDVQQGGGPHPIFDVVVSLHDYRAIEPIALAIPGAGPPEFPQTPGSKFKLMFEYTISVENEVSLRMEYMTSRLGGEVIALLYEALVRCFDGLLEVRSVGSLREVVLKGVDPQAARGLVL